jgi:hypothetical protein
MWRDRQAKLCETASIVSSQRANKELRIMNNDHVILNVHIDAAGQEEKLADQLRALVDPTRSEAGCLVYSCTSIPRIPASSCSNDGSAANPRLTNTSRCRTSRRFSPTGRRRIQIRLPRSSSQPGVPSLELLF